MNRTIAILGLAWLASASLANKAKAKQVVVDIKDLLAFSPADIEPIVKQKIRQLNTVIVPR